MREGDTAALRGMDLCAYVSPMHPWFRVRESWLASVLQPLAIFGRCFPGFGSSLRDVGIIQNVQKTRKYRWLAVLLVPTRKTSSTKPVSLGGQKASFSIQPRGRRVLVNKR